MIKKVCVLGLGYIGLPTALLMANSGIKTIGFDVDKEKINILNDGKLFFREEGLADLYEKVKKKGAFKAVFEVEDADAFIITVPTPVDKGTTDLKYIFNAINFIKPHCKKGSLIIVESTVGPEDCTEKIIPRLKKWDIDFKFAHCTERAVPGNTLHEMVTNNRVIGGMDLKSGKAAKELYARFTKGEIYLTDPTTAAACKVMENTFRSVNIALANEFAQISKELGINVWEAIELTNKHPRVNIHQPGPGVGGHCIPIDPYFLLSKNSKKGIIGLSLRTNEEMPSIICREIQKLVKKHRIRNVKIGILGYAYKKNVDDKREAPAEKIVKILRKDFEVLINDDYVGTEDFLDLGEVLSRSDIILLITDHDQYKGIKFSQYPNIQFVYDTRNLFTVGNFKKSDTISYKLGVDGEYRNDS